MIEEDLTALLETTGYKPYPVSVPSGATAPFLVYQRVSTTTHENFEDDIDLVTATFRVDAYHTSFLELRRLALQIRRALHGQQTDEYAITLEQERDLTDLEAQPGLFRTNLEFRITYAEA